MCIQKHSGKFKRQLTHLEPLLSPRARHHPPRSSWLGDSGDRNRCPAADRDREARGENDTQAQPFPPLRRPRDPDRRLHRPLSHRREVRRSPRHGRCPVSGLGWVRLRWPRRGLVTPPAAGGAAILGPQATLRLGRWKPAAGATAKEAPRTTRVRCTKGSGGAVDPPAPLPRRRGPPVSRALALSHRLLHPRQNVPPPSSSSFPSFPFAFSIPTFVSFCPNPFLLSTFPHGSRPQRQPHEGPAP